MAKRRNSHSSMGRRNFGPTWLSSPILKSTRHVAPDITDRGSSSVLIAKSVALGTTSTRIATNAAGADNILEAG